MGSQWPPSPRVEDEALALKNEIRHKTGVNSKDEVEEARSRGTVDQYPIILDVGHGFGSKPDGASGTDNEGDSVRTQSSDDSYGPPTPPTSQDGRNHVQLPPNPSPSRYRSEEATPVTNPVQDSKNAATSRGRPNIPRIQTAIGGDLQGMISGDRRAPSPYSYTKPEATTKGGSSKRFCGDTFLSPEHINSTFLLPKNDHSKRPSSARPRSKPRVKSLSDDSMDSDTRRRHHSQRRSTRETFSKNAPLPAFDAKTSLNDEKIPRFAGPQLLKAGHVGKGSDAGASSQTAADGHQGKRYSRDSPCTSSAEDSCPKSSSDVLRADKHMSKGVSYMNSADDGRMHRRDAARFEESEGRRSPRGSLNRKARPRLDLSGHRYSYHGAPTEERHGDIIGKLGNPVFGGRSHLEPSSVRSPKAVEEYLEKAFKDNRETLHKESPHPSPLASPPYTSHYSRSDRRPRDYFSLETSAPSESTEAVRPRAPSRGESQYNQIKPLTGMMAGTAGTRIVPPTSRSSTSSTEVYSSSVPSKPASGRRSRNNSPVREERATLSRPGHEHEKTVPRGIRDEERPALRPVSRTGSASYHQPPSASFDRFHMRTGSYASPTAEIPRLNHRAFSYSSADDTLHPRQPNSAKLTQLPFGQSLDPNQSPLPTTPRLPRSPSSSEKAPRAYQLSELPPCPRSLPEAGFYDWYTVVGMPQLDVCPSCMTVIGASRFRDMFVPSTSQVPGQKILCDFSRPWIRNAWTQIIKQRRSSLEMIYQVVRNSETTKPCPGKGSDVRAWYRLPDPETGSNVPNFDACSECVRSIEIIFPQLRGIFKRSGALVQERTCDLNRQSKRFESYLKLLDAAALQYDVERLREPNIQALANYARKTARVRECTRDDMVMGQLWHFIPRLPEFSICEECFDQVVWPVADQPVASSVNRTLQLVPGAQRSTGISCQLYSERMRKAFLEAVKYADFEFLKQVALRRHSVERLLQEKHKLLMSDMAMGRDRTAELQANIEEWRRWE